MAGGLPFLVDLGSGAADSPLVWKDAVDGVAVHFEHDNNRSVGDRLPNVAGLDC
jgi:hypothetical protein